MDKANRPLFVGITGASGAAYADRLVRFLAGRGHETLVCVSAAGMDIFRYELGLAPGSGIFADLPRENPKVYAEADLGAPYTSGSFPMAGVVVVPCSMGTLGAIASGATDNGITRAAEVALKESRPCILVPRETPLSAIHIENMARAARAGATILPAMPAFYHFPKGIADLVDFVVARILDHIGIAHDLVPRWTGWEEGR